MDNRSEGGLHGVGVGGVRTSPLRQV